MNSILRTIKSVISTSPWGFEMSTDDDSGWIHIDANAPRDGMANIARILQEEGFYIDKSETKTSRNNNESEQ